MIHRKLLLSVIEWLLFVKVNCINAQLLQNLYTNLPHPLLDVLCFKEMFYQLKLRTISCLHPLVLY